MRLCFTIPGTISSSWLLHACGYGVLQCVYAEIDFELTDGGLSCLSVFLASCIKISYFCLLFLREMMQFVCNCKIKIPKSNDELFTVLASAF